MRYSDTHIPELDGLRGLAILGVFIFHTHLFIRVDAVPRILIRFFAQGWAGVDLFFVLSGFLITGILLDTKSSTRYFRNFYARRFLRIFPLYYFVLTAVILISALVRSTEVSQCLPAPGEYPFYYAYLTNFLGLIRPLTHENWLGHFWTLAIEEQFYVLWPLCVWFIPKRGLGWLAIVASLAALIFRTVWIYRSGPVLGIAVLTPARIDSLLIGALCAMLYRDGKALAMVRRWLPFAALLGLGSFFLIALSLTEPNQYYSFMLSISYTLLALGFGAVILLIASSKNENNLLRKGLRNPVLMLVGTYSYGIYVFHPILIGPSLHFFVSKLASVPNLRVGLIFIGSMAIATFAISALSYELVERRILLWRRYFTASETAVSDEKSGSVAVIS